MRRTASSSSRAVRPPGSGVPVPGACAGVADVDVDRQEDAVAVVDGDGERLGEAGVQAAVHDLGHLVGAHALLRPSSPASRVPASSRAAPAAGTGRRAAAPRLDEPAHRLAVADEGAELDVAGVGVRVEVDHRHAALPDVLRDARGVGPGDGVVAAEHERHGAGARRRRGRPPAGRAPSAPRRRRTSRRRRRRAPAGPAARPRAAPATGGTRRAAGSRSAGCAAGRSGCRAGATCRRRTARRGSTTSAPS